MPKFHSAEDVKNAIREDTILVSVMMVNNEVGSVMPIMEIGKTIKSIDESIIFHEIIFFHEIFFFHKELPAIGQDLAADTEPPFPLFFSRYMRRTVISAGVTPEIREA